MIRPHIFQFPQVMALKNGLNMNDLLVLDYFYGFFQGDRAVCIRRFGKEYWLIRYSKLLSDLPIIGKSEKTFQRILKKLEDKELIERLVENSKDLYVNLNWKKLFDTKSIFENEPSQNCQGYSIGGQHQDKNDLNLGEGWTKLTGNGGQGWGAIVNYNNKKIIIHTRTRAREMTDFERADILSTRFRHEMQSQVSPEAYGQFLRHLFVDLIDGNDITLGFVASYQDPSKPEEYKIGLDETKFMMLTKKYIPIIERSLERAIRRANVEVDNARKKN